MNKALHSMGEYTLLMMKSITIPDRWSMFFKQLIKEIYKLGVDSLWIVVIISVFIGTVIAIQISLNISSPLIPKFTIGYTTREIILLEFSSSIMCLILAGKVGSNIASEIGTMRVTEQIDAMEDGRTDGLHPGTGDLQYVHGYSRWYCRQLWRGWHDTCLVRIWTSVLFQRVLHLVLHHQVGGLCLHHLLHRCLFRLQREGWSLGSRQGQYECSRHE